MASTTSARESLWWLILGPTVWAMHFLVSYIAAAIYCAKAGPFADLTPIRVAIAVVTVVALAGIVAAGLHARRHWGFSLQVRPAYDADTLSDRRHFLGFATMLLCGVSFVATLYVALPAVVFDTCA